LKRPEAGKRAPRDSGHLGRHNREERERERERGRAKGEDSDGLMQPEQLAQQLRMRLPDRP